MTQLVELQGALDAIREAGFEPFAISNDTVAGLGEFARRHGITFPLLADEDSAVIQRFGILNTLVEPHEGRSMRWYGIPYPGIYVTDPDGVIIDKLFEQHHARRPSGNALLHRLTGTLPEPGEDAPLASTDGADLSLAAHLIDPALRLEVLSTLVCDIDIPPGSHLYAPGAPKAFTPASLTVAGDGLRIGEPAWPEPVMLAMSALDLSVPVWQGRITVAVPITATSALIRLGHGLDVASATVRITLDYQACDENTCSLPSRATLELGVPLATLVEPDGVKTYVARVEEG